MYYTEIYLVYFLFLEHRPSKHRSKKTKKRPPIKKLNVSCLVERTKIPNSCYTSVDVIIKHNSFCVTILILYYLGLSDMDCSQ